MNGATDGLRSRPWLVWLVEHATSCFPRLPASQYPRWRPPRRQETPVVDRSAQWAGSALPIYAATNTVDVIHLAGGGIIAHPGGTAAGVLSMQQGWEAALAGATLEGYAKSHPELRAAIGAPAQGYDERSLREWFDALGTTPPAGRDAIEKV